MFKLNQRSWFPPPFCDVRALKPRMNREQVLPGHRFERVYSDDSGHERTGEKPCTCGLMVEHSGAPLAARPPRGGLDRVTWAKAVVRMSVTSSRRPESLRS